MNTPRYKIFNLLVLPKNSVQIMLKVNLVLCFLVATVAGTTDKRPNFIIFLTDDQDVVLDGMKPMKNVQRFIENNGVTFSNSYTTSPICCPSRASFLTGKYVHNHRTYNNSIDGGCNSPQWKQQEMASFPAIMHSEGYKTFYAGKYLNQYGVKAAGGPGVVPPGWSEWHGLVGNSVYYNYTISNNGVPTYSEDLYLTDVIRDLAINYIESIKSESAPFLMILSPPAPHQPFTPAERHRALYQNVSAVRHDNFNVVAEDKHWLMRMPPSPLPASILPELDRAFRSRWQALMAVDEMVADVVNALELASVLDNTYLLYTSDNGYHIGQFSQVYDKRQPYETDIKVPLLISGPGLNKTTNKSPVLNIDVGPTILSLAGLQPPAEMDGSVIDLFGDVEKRFMLVEYYGEGNTKTVDEACPWKYDGDHLSECYPAYDCKCQDSKNNTFACLRHFARNTNFKYCLFDEQQQTFEEIYDLNQDPYEMNNMVGHIFPIVRHWYTTQLFNMLKCAGADDCNHAPEIPI